MKKIIVLLFIFGLAAVLSSVNTLFWDDNGLPTATIMKLNSSPMAPDFEIEDASGRRKSLQDLRGRVVLLSFWTTW